MKRILPIILLSTVGSAAVADSGMKPGLWEMHMLKNVVDGHDTLAQMAGMTAQMNAAMAKMSAEQRAQMGAMMGRGGMGAGMGAGGAMQMCITPEMAKRDAPVADKDGTCQPTDVQRAGNRVTYSLACASKGAKTSGTGESMMSGDTLTTRSDTTIVEHGETHHVQSEIEFKFVKSDCGNVKPVADLKPH